MKLLVLLLVTLAQSPWVTMKVVDSFTECSDFFMKAPNMEQPITPTVLSGDQYKKICQYFGGSYQYATLFDIKNRIPVYSANVFRTTQKDAPRPNKEPWKNEPRLDNLPGDGMEEYDKTKWEQLMNQAVDKDYPNSGYTRGHVFPSRYANTMNQAISTFTFTNIAPQKEADNKRWGKQVEGAMRKEIKERCKSDNRYEVYIVTGVVPGDTWIPITRNNKQEKIEKGINVPKYYWTAYCCKVNNVMKTKAHMVLQNEQSSRESHIKVSALNKRLTEFYKEEFKVFGDLCVD